MPGMPAGFASGPPPGGSISPSQLASQAAYTVLGNPTAAPASPIATTDPVVSGSATAAQFATSVTGTSAAPAIRGPDADTGISFDSVTKGVFVTLNGVDRLQVKPTGTTAMNTGTSSNVPVMSIANVGGDSQKFLCSGTPEGAITGSPGDEAIDYTNGRFYLKRTGVGNTGWVLIDRCESGTWTPTATIVTNLDAVVPAVSHYIRVGGEVSFSASGTFDPTAAAPTNFGLSLPIASNFAATQDAEGVGVSQTYIPGFVQADITNDRLDVYFTTSGTASVKWTVTGTYTVI